MERSSPRIIHPDARPLRVRPLRLLVWLVGMILFVVAVFGKSWAFLPGIVTLIAAYGPFWGRLGSDDRNVE